MTVTQELAANYSEVDMRLNNEAEDYVKQKENVSQKELDDKPEMVKEFVELITTFTNMTKEEVEKKFKETPDDKKAAFQREVLIKLLSNMQNAPDKLGELEKILEKASPTDLEAALSEVMQKGKSVNATIGFAVRFIKMFKGGSVVARILNLEKKFGIDGLNESLSKLRPDTIAFLTKLANKKLRTIDYAHLIPVMLKIIKQPGDDKEYGYLAFTEEMDQAQIVETSNPTKTTIKGKKKKFILRASTNLTAGCLENDLIVMSVSNPTLYDAFTESIGAVISEQKSGEAFGINIKEFNELKEKIKEIGKALKEADDALAHMQEVSEAAENIENQTEANGNEQIMMQKAEMVKMQLAEVDRQIAPYRQKEVDGSITVEERNEMLSLYNQRNQLVREYNHYMMGVDLKSQDSPWNPSEERLMRQVASTFKARRDEIEKIAPSAEKRTDAQKDDIKMMVLAERFLMNNKNLDLFLKDYYMVTYAEERQQYVEELTKEGKTIPSEIDLNNIAAKRTREVTELMLQNIIIQMYTTTIEAGGEPDTPFSQAVAYAKTSLGYNPKLLVNVINRVLTSYKTTAAQLQDGQKYGLPALFASPEIPHMEETGLRPGANKRAIHQRVDMVFGDSGADIKRFMNSLEREFEVFERAVEGSYTLRFRTNIADGKYYEHLLTEDAPYIKSDTFDIVHLMKDGDKFAKYLPGLKAIMDDFFAQRGWYLAQELERDPLGHEITIFKVFKEYIEKYYPELSENQQRKFAYIAFQQGYAHGYFQQMLSRTRMSAGFQGKLFNRANALHNLHYNAYMFAFEDPGTLTDNKHWGRGSRVLPAWYKDGDEYWGPDADPTGKTENIDHTISYGALIQFGTGKFGNFLTYTDDHFRGTETKAMTPFNLFQTGSDDNYRGWRQQSKSLGNVSTTLWDRVPYKDEIKLNTKTDDAYSLIWKSVENIGINYVRSWFGDVKVGVALMDRSAMRFGIKDDAKMAHFMKFLYRRYFSEGVGKSLLNNKSEFKNVTDDESFWLAFESVATKSKYTNGNRLDEKAIEDETKRIGKEAGTVFQDILYTAYTTMLAERNPLTLMNKVTRWTTQTGVTLYDIVREKHFRDLKEDEFAQVRHDLIAVQMEARDKVTEQIKDNRKDWESTGTMDRNIYGDFSKDKSSVSITGQAGDNGYAINERTIEVLLREKLSKDKNLTAEQVEKRIANAKKLHNGILTGFTQLAEIPKYSEVRAYLESNIDKAYKKSEAYSSMTESEKAKFKKKLIDERLGVNEEEYLAKYKQDHLGLTDQEFAEKKQGQKLETHAEWFIHLWQGGYFGMEPENDYSEYLTTYRNPDKDHIWRMAGMTEATSVAVKKLLDDPDNDKSIEVAVKDFAKDPFKAVDAMASYLNPFRKIVENELGKEAAGRYINYYTLMCIDMALKEDKFRSGPTAEGWAGVFRDFVEAATGGTRKQSAAADRYQNFISKSLTASEGYAVAKYIWQKKLVNPDGFNALKKRMKATIPDILFEKMPYLAMFFIIALMQQAIIKPTQDELTGKKK